MEILLTKTMQGFIPANEGEFEKIKKFKLGVVIRADVAQVRNPKFHRKWFALVNIAFDAWSDGIPAQEYKGHKVSPDFDRFRKDITILCGLYKPVFNVKGEMRLEAESISFANMSEERFEQLYSKTIDVILQKILANRGYTEEKLRNIVDQVIGFA